MFAMLNTFTRRRDGLGRLDIASDEQDIENSEEKEIVNTAESRFLQIWRGTKIGSKRRWVWGKIAVFDWARKTSFGSTELSRKAERNRGFEQVWEIGIPLWILELLPFVTYNRIFIPRLSTRFAFVSHCKYFNLNSTRFFWAELPNFLNQYSFTWEVEKSDTIKSFRFPGVAENCNWTTWHNSCKRNAISMNLIKFLSVLVLSNSNISLWCMVTNFACVVTQFCNAHAL